jgi:hypothetical protein
MAQDGVIGPSSSRSAALSTVQSARAALDCSVFYDLQAVGEPGPEVFFRNAKNLDASGVLPPNVAKTFSLESRIA